MTEAELQCQIVDALRLHGCTVLVTSARSYRPATDKRRGYGADRGVPDLLVAPPYAPPSVWLGLEVKSRTGRLTPEQRALAEAGRIVVVRSLREAFGAVLAYYTHDDIPSGEMADAATLWVNRGYRMLGGLP